MKVRLFQQRRPLRLLGERDEERLEGEMAHLALYFLSSYTGKQEELEQAVHQALALYPEPLERREHHFRTLVETLSQALKEPRIRALFKPGLKDLREHPYVKLRSSNLEIHRPDRIIFFPEGPLVVEYKLARLQSSHVLQLREYLRDLSRIWKAPLRGVLVGLRPPAYREVKP